MTRRHRRPRRTVSNERKGLYLAGLSVQVTGGIGFLLCALGFMTGGMQSVGRFEHDRNPFQWWIGALFCMVAIAVGGLLRRVAARGVAGSGLVLDPERAREDLEPWARTGGGLLRDAIDEAGLERGDEKGEPTVPTVMVRCRQCRTLNDEQAKYCDSCGAAL